ncbi:MAG: DUF3822 family protein [Bacteroidales bacterium]|nr:DUF3822 family protein [Bacteroidales bacterium]
MAGPLPKRPKCTLVPSDFFNPENPREALQRVCRVDDGEEVKVAAVPQFGAFLVYVSGGEDNSLPEMYHILTRLEECRDYNRILLSWTGGYLHLAIAQGRTLLLSNVYEAPDFTTAQYYLFLALKSLQLNPELSTVCLLRPLCEDDRMSLYRYFKSVEVL